MSEKSVWNEAMGSDSKLSTCRINGPGCEVDIVEYVYREAQRKTGRLMVCPVCAANRWAAMDAQARREWRRAGMH